MNAADATGDPLEQPGTGELALAMGGGGARAAYQAGVLRHIARRFPDVRLPILTGVSAGAINTAYLANRRAGIPEAVEELADLWRGIRTDHVFESGSFSLAAMALRWGLRLVSGGSGLRPRTRGLVDTRPLRDFLTRHLRADGARRLQGIEANLARGALRAVAITSTNYATGQSVTWVQGRGVRMWQRPHRISRPAELTVKHVMASSSLPIFFPAIHVGDEWHGDGGIRLTAPLSPALHLGADRVLAISTRYRRSSRDADERSTEGYPPPAQVLGVLMNAIFLDMFDFDADNLSRVNELIRHLPEEQRMGLRVVELLVLRPSVDLGRLASKNELKLPAAFRFLTRGLGTRETKSPDSLSMVMFEPDYIGQLIELGERDAAAHDEHLAAFLAGHERPSLDRTSFRRI